MIAISSHRPHSGSEEYRTHQRRAKESWEKAFSKIFYFGPVEPELASAKTTFIASDPWPQIKLLAHLASQQHELTAIINADIIVTANLLGLERLMPEHYVQVVTSRRCTVIDGDMERAVIDTHDKGLDIFVALPSVWSRISYMIPDCFRIGHQQWDQWMVGFCSETYGRAFRHFNQLRAVFHPEHKGRNMPYKVVPNDHYCQLAEWPMPI